MRRSALCAGGATRVVKRPDWDSNEWRPPKRWRSAGEAQAERIAKAFAIFDDIRSKDGLPLARRVFANLGREPHPLDTAATKKIALVHRLRNMTPKPNIQLLARELAAKDKLVPGSKKYEKALYRHEKSIHRAVADYPALLAEIAGIWKRDVGPGKTEILIIRKNREPRKRGPRKSGHS
jgi:hypothetical protein